MNSAQVDISPEAVERYAKAVESCEWTYLFNNASDNAPFREHVAGQLRALRSALTARDIEIERLKKFEPVCKCDPAGWNLSPIPPPCNHFEWDGGSDKVKVCVRCEHDETCHGARS